MKTSTSLDATWRALLAGCALASGCQSGSQVVSPDVVHEERDVVAIVDGHPIEPQALNTRFDAGLPYFAAPDGSFTPAAALGAKLRIADELIDEALVEAEAARRGLTVSDAEVDGRLPITLPGGAGGALDPDLRARARRELLAERVAGVDDVVVSDQMVDSYYADYASSLAPQDGAPPTLAEAREQIRQLLTTSLREARRDQTRRRLRASAAVSNDIESRYAEMLAAGTPDLSALVSGTPPPLPGATSAETPLTVGR